MHLFAHPPCAPGLSRLPAWLPRRDAVLLLLTVLLFTVLPQLDLELSRLFYSYGRNVFIGRELWINRFIYQAIPVIGWSVTVGLLIAFFACRLSRRTAWRAWTPRLAFLLAVMVAGPGLVATALKDHWHRARPVQLAEFDGRLSFTPPLRPTDQCGSNCSFVSGHAMVGFCFMALAWLSSSHRRRLMMLGVAAGAAVGLARMMQGGHFLSDVMFAGWIVYGLCRVFDAWLLGQRPSGRTAAPVLAD